MFLFVYMYAAITDENVKPIGVSQPHAFYHKNPDVVASANNKQQATGYMKKIVGFNNWGTVPAYLKNITGMTVSGYTQNTDGIFIKHTNNTYGLALQTFLAGSNLSQQQVLDRLSYFCDLYQSTFKTSTTTTNLETLSNAGVVPFRPAEAPEKKKSRVDTALDAFAEDKKATATSVNISGWSSDELLEAKTICNRKMGPKWDELADRITARLRPNKTTLMYEHDTSPTRQTVLAHLVGHSFDEQTKARVMERYKIEDQGFFGLEGFWSNLCFLSHHYGAEYMKSQHSKLFESLKTQGQGALDIFKAKWDSNPEGYVAAYRDRPSERDRFFGFNSTGELNFEDLLNFPPDVKPVKKESK